MKINWKNGQKRYGRKNAYAYISNEKYCVGINGTSTHGVFEEKKAAKKYLESIQIGSNLYADYEASRINC